RSSRLRCAAPAAPCAACCAAARGTRTGPFCSCRAPEFGRQRVQARGLGLDQPELADEVAELRQDARAPRAAGEFGVARDQAGEVLAVVLEALRRDPQDVDQLVVVAVDEV